MDSPPNRFTPKPRFDYQPPSLLADYKYLAIAFIAVVAAVSVWLIWAPHHPYKIDPPPVYVEPLHESQPLHEPQPAPKR